MNPTLYLPRDINAQLEHLADGYVYESDDTILRAQENLIHLFVVKAREIEARKQKNRSHHA